MPTEFFSHDKPLKPRDEEDVDAVICAASWLWQWTRDNPLAHAAIPPAPLAHFNKVMKEFNDT